eukprot:Colp12_sorted_trinity150504_noHs@31988
MASTTGEEFPPLKNDLILRAAQRQRVERIPVWVMRQAGRYLPEFREVRKSADFFTMCRTPELACEVTLQPIRRYPLDAAIIFSDILVVPQAMGLTVEMLPGKGPHFPEPLVDPSHMSRLNLTPDVKKELDYVYKAITLTRHKLEGKVPLLGFCGAPWTIMAYMIEGGGSKTLSKAKTWLFRYPEESKTLLHHIAEISVQYLVEQVLAGAQMLQVFESWGGELSPGDFNTFALPHLRYIASEVKSRLGDRAVPMTVFAKGSHYALESLSNLSYDVVGLDWTMAPEEARHRTHGRVALQGNLDPSALFGTPESIREATSSMLEKFGVEGYIANLGHGMYPEHDPEHLKAFIETVVGYSSELCRKRSLYDLTTQFECQ